MAAPADMTTLDISGTFQLNKSISDSTDEILKLQGISWLTRSVISMATITLYIKHYKNENGEEKIDIEQIGTGGFKGNFEERTLTWTDRALKDPLFGYVSGRSRRLKVEEVENQWMKEDWSPDTIEHGVINSYAESDTPNSGTTWVAEQIWGFADVDGVRRYVRRVHFTGPNGEIITARMAYDYIGPNTR